MPTNLTPATPPANTDVVPRKVRRLVPQTGNQQVDQFVTLLQAGIAEPLDRVLAYLNGVFALPPPKKISNVAGTLAGAVQQTSSVVGRGDASFNNLTASGNVQVSGAAAIAGAVSTGPLTVAGNFTPQYGYRSCPISGYVTAASLNTAGTYTIQSYTCGAGVAEYQIIPFAGSLAALTVGGVTSGATAGSVSIRASSINTGPFGPTWTVPYNVVNSGSTITFAAGQYIFSAGFTLSAQVTSSGWTQPTGATGLQIGVWVYC